MVGTWKRGMGNTKQELMEDFKGHEAGIGGRFQGVVGGDWELEAEVWVAGSKKEQRVGTGSLDLIF